jgi:hypothetical protein
VKAPRAVIGRNPDCTIRIPVSEVSRQHCEIASDDATAVIRDLGSSNGTFVNQAAIAEHKLAAGDVIVIGPATFVVQLNGVPSKVDAQAVLAAAKAPAKAAVKPQSNLQSKPSSKPQPNSGSKPGSGKTAPAKDKSAGSSFGLPPLSGDLGDSSVVDFDFSDDEKDLPKL